MAPEDYLRTHKCAQDFPKDRCKESGFVGSQAQYKRDTLGDKWRNMFVVPYNSTLLAIFGFHINVELATTLHVAKYVTKTTDVKGYIFTASGGKDPVVAVDKADEINFHKVTHPLLTQTPQ
jgi:hypothetical protein